VSGVYDKHWSLRPDPAEIPRIRREVSHFVAETCGMSAERRPDLELALSEVVTNALLHGYRGRDGDPISVDVHVDGKVEFVVRDNGVGMRPHPSSGGAGLGLTIVMAIADDLEISDCEGGGTEVRVTFEQG
jgi:anti-sigma regulatory factor (Ser/Thr protein kinase)